MPDLKETPEFLKKAMLAGVGLALKTWDEVEDFTRKTGQVLNGDGTNWLDQQRIPSIAVLLPDYVTVEWNNNLAGIQAVLRDYGN